MRLSGACVTMLALTACGRAPDRQAPPNEPQAIASNDDAATVPPPGTGPDARTPLAPVKPAIDPKSTAGAAEIIQDYADLMEHRRFADAARLWTDDAAAERFATQLSPEVHVRIGKLGSTEGAAGSIYTTIPVTFFGDTYSKPAQVTLRRVNDVPGSTEAQRRWHIERIDWTSN